MLLMVFCLFFFFQFRVKLVSRRMETKRVVRHRVIRPRVIRPSGRHDADSGAHTAGNLTVLLRHPV